MENHLKGGAELPAPESVDTVTNEYDKFKEQRKYGRDNFFIIITMVGSWRTQRVEFDSLGVVAVELTKSAIPTFEFEETLMCSWLSVANVKKNCFFEPKDSVNFQTL